MRTLTPEQFKKTYGDKSLVGFKQPIKEPGYFQRVGQGIKETFTGLGQDLQTQADVLAKPDNLGEDIVALGRGGLRTAGAFAKGALTPVMEAPGIKQATEFVGEQIADTAPMQKFAEWAGRHPEAAKDIENTLDIAGLLGTASSVKPLVKGVAKGVKVAGEQVGKTAQTIAKSAQVKAPQISQNIMNRVARLNPTDEIKFKNVAGKSPGQYLVDTGNFGAPDKILSREATKFIESKSLVDDALAKLPGEYQVNPVDDALKLLSQKGAKVSTPGVKAPFIDRVAELMAKHQAQGLNMSEINEVKRLFEREIKLGYNKMLKPNLVQKATNVDSAIRKWQFNKADYLGFKNIGEMNRQTQISKFLINKLGDKVIGQQALNNITLTDWVILSGGDPAAIGGFLTKKFFSSPAIQAKIAKLLHGETGESGIITPEISLQPEYLGQKALPAGNIQKGVYPSTGTSIPSAPTTFEPQASNVPPKKFLDIKVLQNIENLTPDEMNIPIRSLNLTPKNLLRLGIRYLKEKKLIPTTSDPTKRAKTIPIFKPSSPLAQEVGKGKLLTKEEMIKRGAGGHLNSAVEIEIPLSKIDGREPIPAMAGGYKKGRQITQPIETRYDPETDKFILYAGNHRVRQAEINGQKTIKAFVEMPKAKK